MANEEHLEVAKAGAVACSAWRTANPHVRLDLSEASLSGVDLSGADLSEAKLSGAALDGADLSGAYLVGARLERANLVQANLSRADLSDANLTAADLREADLIGATFEGADLSVASVVGNAVAGSTLTGAKLFEAKLTGCDLEGADLSGTDLHAADLSGGDLRGVRGAVFDSTRLAGADLSPNAPDKWSILRRKYTGPAFFLNLLLLIAFALPYVARVLQWRAKQAAQSALVQVQDQLKAVAAAPEGMTPESLDGVRAAIEVLSGVTPCLAADCEEWPVWLVLLGFDKGWGYFALSLALIAYNVFRGVLTHQISALREAEARSGRTPPLGTHHPLKPGYLRFWWAHRALQLLAVVAMSSVVWHAWHWLTLTVSLPAR